MASNGTIDITVQDVSDQSWESLFAGKTDPDMLPSCSGGCSPPCNSQSCTVGPSSIGHD